MNDKSFESIVKLHADTVYRIAINICKNPEDSKDVMQNVFLRFYKKQNSFSSDEHIKAWLIRVAINESKRILGANAKGQSVPLDEVANTLFAEDTAQSELFTQVMSLDEKYRMVIYLYYYEGYSVNDIARILRRNSATVRTQLARAREKLKIKLTEDDYE